MTDGVQAQKAVVARYVGKLVIGADGQQRPVPFAAPRPPDPFVGRREAVDEIVERLIGGASSSGPLALTALDGGPGVGKDLTRSRGGLGPADRGPFRARCSLGRAWT